LAISESRSFECRLPIVIDDLPTAADDFDWVADCAHSGIVNRNRQSRISNSQSTISIVGRQSTNRHSATGNRQSI